jgi:ribosomal protein S18 acetylase RimI-like enzyme
MNERLQKSAGLGERQLAEIRRLEGACNEYEGLTMKLNWDLLRNRPQQLVNDFLYYRDGELTAYLALYTFNGCEAEVSAMTHPQQRRQGIFTRLLTAAAEELQKRTVTDFLFICEQASASGAACLAAIGASYDFSEYRMDLVDPARTLDLPAELQIRPAHLEDVNALAQMDAACFSMPVDERRGQLMRSLASNTRPVLIATVGPAKVGKIQLTVEADGAIYISAVCVLPEYRSRGYGKAILARTVRQLTAAQYRNISLEVATENRHALSLYEQCGFAVTTAYDYYRLPKF